MSLSANLLASHFHGHHFGDLVLVVLLRHIDLESMLSLCFTIFNRPPIFDKVALHTQDVDSVRIYWRLQEKEEAGK